ncbi:kielin/chordin-like protein [Dreissena polymorpha]|uniref:Kielin/chordin-like protein n=1 Tax=Dreissena polymorpha TaxID=45954 RepID=A0A9D3YRJ9_DREPO|nr:kielin/chordin-like protein [Dreissena polymorpha]KAH3702913.1 hypothetical protein DPMN_077940 [Dreissena polymorpha]
MRVRVVCLTVLACTCVFAQAVAGGEIKPVKGKPGFCTPSLDPSEPKCKDRCKTDANCKDNRKCCMSGCGQKCVVPSKDDCSVVADCMPLTCKRIHMPPGACCPVCKNNGKSKNCKKNGKIYREGEDVPDDDPCMFCRCDSGEVVCAIMDCAAPPCEDPFSIPGQCCPVCNTDTSCKVGDKVFKDLEDIPDENPCESCICSRGEVVCSTVFCDVPQCVAPAVPFTAPGECCPGCKDVKQ